MTFRTRYDHFEYKILFMSLSNASVTFQVYVNKTLIELLDVCCIAYLNDILIYSKIEQNHVRDVKAMLELLRKAELFVKLEKCVFHARSIEFLEFDNDQNEINMKKEKVQVVQDWLSSRTLKQVQSVVEFANFYRRFISNF